MKTTTFTGTKEDLLKVVDKALHLGFTKALIAKQALLTGEVTELKSTVEDGFTDPTLVDLVLWAKINTKCSINQV